MIMGADYQIVLQWWGTLFLVGAVAWPFTRRLFAGWLDQGYFFSKAVGMAVVSYLVFILGVFKLLPFTWVSVVGAMGLVFFGGLLLVTNSSEKREVAGGRFSWKFICLIFLEEVVFLGLLLFWSWVKAHEPSIRGLEKFMDYGFMQSILVSEYFPPVDMWYAGGVINYYYFGHLVVAVLTRVSGLDLAYTFNLMLATIFALGATMSFGIGYQLAKIGPIRQIGTIGQIFSGLLTAFLVTLSGNMQTIYAFTRGYNGEDTPPGFWTIWSPIFDIWTGMKAYWYANATRFIPFTIHEFPGYSFVVSDVHGHVLSIPFVLLALALLIVIFSNIGRISLIRLIFYGFLVAILLTTNALDGPVYAGLFVVLYLALAVWPDVVRFGQNLTLGDVWRLSWPVGLVGLVAALTALPFLWHFKSFVNGLAVNCPPKLLENRQFGPLIFETVDKCQKSPLWMWWLLWGFFIYCGIWFIVRSSSFEVKKDHKPWWKRLKLHTEFTQIEKVLVIWFVVSLGLWIFPEFFYFKDIYPAHFRSNTMFKLGYQAFIMCSIFSAYIIISSLSKLKTQKTKIITLGRTVFFVLLIPQLFLVSIFPIFAVRSYFGELKTYYGIYGLNWMVTEYPDDLAGIKWLNSQPRRDTDVLVEADGDSYTDYERFSAFTGMPTIVGWAVHEWLWRGTYDVVAPRREEVRQIYETPTSPEAAAIIKKYPVRYIIIGRLEREKFADNLDEAGIGEIADPVFASGQLQIYQVSQ